MHGKMGFLDGKVLNPKEGFPSGEHFYHLGKGEWCSPPINPPPGFLYHAVDGGSVTMTTKPPAVALKGRQGELTSGGGRKWGRGGGEVRWAQILATPTGPLRRGKWGQLQSAPGSWEQAAGLGTLCAKGGLRRQAAADYRTFHQSSCNRSALDSVPLRRSTL